MPRHEGLTIERWVKFPVAHQVLMIANELHRARNLSGESAVSRRQDAYERAPGSTGIRMPETCEPGTGTCGKRDR